VRGDGADINGVPPAIACRHVKAEHEGRILIVRGMKGTRFGSFVAERLLTILSQDPDGSARVNAASALGEFADRLALDPLLTSLRKAHRALKSLVAALQDQDARVRRYAAKALGTFGDQMSQAKSGEAAAVSVRTSPRP